MNEQYVSDHIIFECIVGSQAYGLNDESSDTDYSGVMIPGKEYFLGFDKFEQYQGYDFDKTIYDIRKALTLIADNNPNMLDLIYTPERCVVKTTPYWNKIIENRDMFLSKRIRYTFSGYAIAQLNRIKTHRKFLLNPPKGQPQRKDYSLPDNPMFPSTNLKSICESALTVIREEDKGNLIRELDSIHGDYVMPLFHRYLIQDENKLALEWLQGGLKSQLKSILSLGTEYIKEEYIDLAQRELHYYNAYQEWKQYEHWKKHRNKKRAEMEEKYGYDPKHSMHLIRLLRTGKEGLETGTINVDRTNIDAEELKAIKKGAWTYEQVEDYAKNMDTELTELYNNSKLQKSPQRNKIANLCVDIVEDYLGN